MTPKQTTLPPRTPDTMIDAIALSSPSGRMSQRARKAASKRLAIALFGPTGRLPVPEPPSGEQAREIKRVSLLHAAKDLRELAARGMSVRKYTKHAELLETEAKAL